MDDPGFDSRPAGARNVSVLQGLLTASGSHPAFYTQELHGSFPGVNRTKRESVLTEAFSVSICCITHIRMSTSRTRYQGRDKMMGDDKYDDNDEGASFCYK
jgi:hypothetical protein